MFRRKVIGDTGGEEETRGQDLPPLQTRLDAVTS